MHGGRGCSIVGVAVVLAGMSGCLPRSRTTLRERIDELTYSKRLATATEVRLELIVDTGDVIRGMLIHSSGPIVIASDHQVTTYDRAGQPIITAPRRSDQWSSTLPAVFPWSASAVVVRDGLGADTRFVVRDVSTLIALGELEVLHGRNKPELALAAGIIVMTEGEGERTLTVRRANQDSSPVASWEHDLPPTKLAIADEGSVVGYVARGCLHLVDLRPTQPQAIELEEPVCHVEQFGLSPDGTRALVRSAGWGTPHEFSTVDVASGTATVWPIEQPWQWRDIVWRDPARIYFLGDSGLVVAEPFAASPRTLVSRSEAAGDLGYQWDSIWGIGADQSGRVCGKSISKVACWRAEL